MSDGSKIQWTEATWSPTTGCDRTSSGCDNCYALTLAKRLKARGSAKYQNDGDPRTSGSGFGLTIHPATLDIPRHWRKPRRIFVNSMSDLFHARVPLDFVRQVFDVIARTPQHTYQVLTKRASRLPKVAGRLDWPPNLWMGVSVEDAEHLDRTDDLRAVPAAIRFLSLEPLLGPLAALDLDGISWVSWAESPGKVHGQWTSAWAREIVQQCRQSGTAPFVKQLGAVLGRQFGGDSHGGDWDHWPEDLKLRDSRAAMGSRHSYRGRRDQRRRHARPDARHRRPVALRAHEPTRTPATGYCGKWLVFSAPEAVAETWGRAGTPPRPS